MSTRRKPQPARRIGSAVSTGIKVEAGHRHHSRIAAPAPGQHMWAAFAVFALRNPAADRFELDTENLVTIEGPGCFVCEQTYTPAVAAAPCPGDPSSLFDAGGRR